MPGMLGYRGSVRTKKWEAADQETRGLPSEARNEPSRRLSEVKELKVKFPRFTVEELFCAAEPTPWFLVCGAFRSSEMNYIANENRLQVARKIIFSAEKMRGRGCRR